MTPFCFGQGLRNISNLIASDCFVNRKSWLSVITDLQARGVADIFIACIDGLTGFKEAIQAIFPQT